MLLNFDFTNIKGLSDQEVKERELKNLINRIQKKNYISIISRYLLKIHLPYSI